MQTELTAADLLVQCLEREGVEYVFGVPGEENADFLMSLDRSDSIRFIVTRHEQGAAFMADTYGRLTGNPAVALGTLGPGATNLVTGVANANMDRSPMIVLTGQGDVQRQHKESHQVMDVVPMFRPITKWSHAIRHPDTVAEVVRKAVRLCRAEKPGAVHIELAEDIAKLTTSARPLTPRRFRRPAPDTKALGETVELLQKARRPVIIAGNGTIRRRASTELRRLCEATGLGVISTFMAKGCVSLDSDFCLFTIGLQQRDQLSLHVAESDLVVTIGYDMSEYPPRLWNYDGDKPIVHIDFVPAEIDAHYHPQVEVIGDVGNTLALLADHFEAETTDFDTSWRDNVRRAMQQEFEEYGDDDTVGTIKPQKVIADVRAELAPDDVLLCGVGAHKMWVGRYFHCYEPNTCLISNGFCSMGMPVPGSIAAALVQPDRRCLALTGDGDFLMNVQEMETARRLNCDITVLVWQDDDYGLITWKQQSEFGRAVDMTFGNPKWASLAEAFGWQCHTVKRSLDLRSTLRAALDEPGPSLVVVPIDYRENEKLTKRLGDIASRL